MSETGINLTVGIVIGIFATSFVVAVIAMARAGSVQNAFWGLTIAGRSRIDAAFSVKLHELTGTPMPVVAATPTSRTILIPAKPTAPPKPTGEALRLLALLQTESRLVDFLMEDIKGAADAQIGQAVKEIHQKASKVLKDHLTLVEILAGADCDTVTVQTGFDPSAIRVIGNVTGQPPFTGSLQHPGWKVKEIKLPPLPEGQDPFVLQPAEVELP